MVTVNIKFKSACNHVNTIVHNMNELSLDPHATAKTVIQEA